MSSVPKMPHRIKDVHAQILNHPEYKTRTTEGTRFAFEMGCVGGYSWRNQENNKWSREIWKDLYTTNKSEI